MSMSADQIRLNLPWIKSAATALSSFVAAIAVAWTAFMWLVEPRVVEWAELLVADMTQETMEETRRTREQLERLDHVVDRLESGVEALAVAVEGSSAPAWRFAPSDTSISDGMVGGFVTIRASGYKLRECGIPRVDLFFIDAAQISHRFTEASLLSPDGRGIALPVDPDRMQSVSYSARIPMGDRVRPGRAVGFVAASYPDGCPMVPETISGPLAFRINGRGLGHGGPP